MPCPEFKFVGNAVRDAKTGTDKNGKPYLMVTVACNDSHKDDQDNWVTDRSVFLDVSLFDANPSMRIPVKGDRVVGFGKLSEETTEKDGVKYHHNRVIAKFVDVFEKQAQSKQGWNNTQQPVQNTAPWGSSPNLRALGNDEPPF